MKIPNLLPAIVRRRPGRVELSVSPLTRALYLGLGTLLVLVLLRQPSGRPFAVMFAIVIALAAMAEDRWIFDGEAGEVRKRFGLFVLAKSWAIDLGAVASVELESDFSGAEGGDPYGAVRIAERKGHCAMRLVLADGRTLVVCSARRALLPDLRERAAAAAEAIGRPLVEA